MGLETTTPEQRYAARDAAYKLAAELQSLAQAQPIVDDSVSADITTEASAVVDAVSALGISVGAAGDGATVANGDAAPAYDVNGKTQLVTGSKALVVDGKFTGVALPATVAVYKNGGTQTILDASGAKTDAAVVVGNNAITSITMPANRAIAYEGQSLTVSGGTVKLSVAKGVITATYTASS